MDIETAANLISESGAKLVKTKSRGLTHMLVVKAVITEKVWDGIKDLPRLKLCNANIHTYTSCFLDIQQWEKESLAAYVHWFKTEAKQCKFMNDTATIRIFIKGPRNTHSLAAIIYEKHPQTLLKDAITEVEKLDAAQQFTATIILSSTINMMSNEEDQCFQCQKLGHITQNCPHIRCYECDEYGHIVMDCPHKIPPLGTPVPHHTEHRNCHSSVLGHIH